MRRRRAGRVHAIQPPVHIEQLGGLEPFVEAEVLGQKADPRHRHRIAGRPAQHACVAAAGRDQPQQHLDRGALAGAIWPQKAKNLTPRHLQSEIVDGDLRAIDFA